MDFSLSDNLFTAPIQENEELDLDSELERLKISASRSLIPQKNPANVLPVPPRTDKLQQLRNQLNRIQEKERLNSSFNSQQLEAQFSPNNLRFEAHRYYLLAEAFNHFPVTVRLPITIPFNHAI
jgi:hypothetical protein